MPVTDSATIANIRKGLIPPAPGTHWEIGGAGAEMVPNAATGGNIRAPEPAPTAATAPAQTRTAPGVVVGHTAAGNPIVQQADGTQRIDYSKALTPAGTYVAAGGAAPTTPASPNVRPAPRSPDVGVAGPVFPTLPSAALSPPLPFAPAPTAAVPLPAAAPSGTVTIGEREDYRAAAETALHAIGIVNPERLGLLQTKDIDRFALAKMDAEAIAAYYSRTPEVQAISPGAEYGMGRQEYFGRREATEEAYGARFGEPSSLPETRRRARAPEQVGPAAEEPAWLKEMLQERYTPEESAGLFGDYFRNVGRAPTAEEVGLYRTRARDRFAERAVEPRYARVGARPVATELAQRERGSVFGRTR